MNRRAVLLAAALLACQRNRPPEAPDPPFGTTEARTGVGYVYGASAYDPEGDSVSVRFDFGGDVSEWSTLTGSGDGVRLTCVWPESGTFAVTAQARDKGGRESGWSPALTVLASPAANHAPRAPGAPLGRSDTRIGIACSFTASAADPDSDRISFQFVWQDGDTSAWTPAFPPGAAVTLGHEWQQPGSHAVRARSRDTRGAVSDWSRSHPVRVSAEGTVQWRCAAAPADYACPAIGPDGTLYINSESGGLLAIGPGGTALWQNVTTALAPPSIPDDTTIYAALGLETATRLVALRPDGSIRWSFHVGSDVYSAPAVAESGTVYLATIGGLLHAVNPDSTLRWSVPVGPVAGSAAIGPDGTIYVCRLSDSLVAVGPDGIVKWTHALATAAFSALAIAADGTIYCPTFEGSDDFLLALDPDGTEKWRCPVGWASAAPVIGPDRTIYVASRTGALYAVSAEGRLQWSYAAGGTISSPPAVTEDGSICFGCEDSSFYSVNPDGTLRWRLRLDVPVRNSPVAIAPDGTIYFHAGGALFALHGESPLATGDWPKFQRDARNTARAR